MARFHVGLVVTVGLLSVASLAIQQVAWKRQYVGKSALSMHLPGLLESLGETKVEDDKDWVEKSDDYILESDDFFVYVSVFHAKKGQKVDESRLTTVGKDLVVGISENEESVKETGRKVGKLDERPTLLQSHVLGKGADASLFKSFLLADTGRVFAVMAVGNPGDMKSGAAIDRVMGSIRFKAGLKE
jgi:hypothetical protein